MIARAARQISSTYHEWEAFVFSPDRTYLGRICHRKVCPSQTARCDNIACGRTPYIGNLHDFDFDSALFLAPPIEILWRRKQKSVLLEWKETLGARLAEQEQYLPITLKCWDCGKRFLFPSARRNTLKAPLLPRFGQFVYCRFLPGSKIGQVS